MAILKTINKMLKIGQVSSETLCIKMEDVKNRVACKTTERQLKWLKKMINKHGIEDTKKLIETAIAVNKGDSSLKKLLELAKNQQTQQQD